MMRRLIAGLAVVVLVVAPACSGGGGDDDSFRLEVDGRAEVTAAGGDRRVVEEGGHDVATGDTVRMLEGDAVFELPGDRSLLMRAYDDDATVVAVGDRPEVLEGDAVLVAAEDTRFRVGDVDVRLPEGAARVQRGLSVTIGVYAGTAEVRSAGRAFADGLRALRQLSIPATGVLPREGVPLVYDADAPDPWDLRFLGDAIDLGVRLDLQSRGFTGQLGPSARVDADLLRTTLPSLAGVAALDRLVAGAERTPGESLVGAAIVVETGSSVEDRWDDVFGFRDAGAAWGLVALDQRVGRDPLLDRIAGAFGRSPLLFAAGPATSVGSSASPPVTSSPPTSPTVTTPPSDPEEPSPPTTPPTTTPPILSPIIGLLPQPGDPGDGGDGSSSDATPPAPVEETTETLTEIVNGVTEIVDGVVGGIVEGVLGEDPASGGLLP